MTQKFIERICKMKRIVTNRATYERHGDCIFIYKENFFYPLVRRVPEKFREGPAL
jgi:hypothetical protein